MIPFLPFFGEFRIFTGLLLLLIFLLIQVNVIHYAFEKVGIDHRLVFLVLLISFVGSAINIPVAEVSRNAPVFQEWGTDFKVRVMVPQEPVVLAVNVGGALIPTVVSLYLMLKMVHIFRALIAIGVVALLSHQFAMLVPGVGITIPAFIPPVAAALSAILLCRPEAPQIAYISGSLGTLIGADLLNLGHIATLGSSFVSIGGAGTFDGIFFSSIIAVLLVSI